MANPSISPPNHRAPTNQLEGSRVKMSTAKAPRHRSRFRGDFIARPRLSGRPGRRCRLGGVAWLRIHPQEWPGPRVNTTMRPLLSGETFGLRPTEPCFLRKTPRRCPYGRGVSHVLKTRGYVKVSRDNPKHRMPSPPCCFRSHGSGCTTLLGHLGFHLGRPALPEHGSGCTSCLVLGLHRFDFASGLWFSAWPSCQEGQRVPRNAEDLGEPGRVCTAKLLVQAFGH